MEQINKETLTMLYVEAVQHQMKTEDFIDIIYDAIVKTNDFKKDIQLLTYQGVNAKGFYLSGFYRGMEVGRRLAEINILEEQLKINE